MGEFGKSVYLISAGLPKSQAIGIVLLDRLMDVIVIGFMAIIGVGILFDWVTALLLLILVLLGTPFLWWIFKTNITLRKMLNFFGFANFIPSIHTLALTLIATIISWALYFVWAIFLARIIGIDVQAHIMISVFTITGILSLVPIAPSGLGTRDTALIILLSSYGVATHEAVSLGILMFSLLILSGSLGLYYWAIKKNHEDLLPTTN